LRQKIRESPTEQKIRQTGIRKVQSSSSAQRETHDVLLASPSQVLTD
jgi:hypothetical protein